MLGGTRFIGYHLTEALLEQGARVSILHRGQTLEPRQFSREVRRVRADRERPEDLAPFFDRKYDAVVDLTGYAARHVEPVAYGFASKIDHYVFCSTSSVYQKATETHYTEASARVSAPNTYGGEKALAEDALAAAAPKLGLKLTILRPQGVYGPWDTGPVNYVLTRVAKGKPVLVTEQQAGRRLSLLYVKDLARVFCAAIKVSPQLSPRIFNVCGDESVTALELVEACGAALGRPAVARTFSPGRFPYLSFGLRWLDHDLVASNSRVKSELGVRFSPFREGGAETWSWLRANPGRLKIALERGEEHAANDKSISWSTSLKWRLSDYLTRAMRG